jgi:long-chain fatty acid transport protein
MLPRFARLARCWSFALVAVLAGAWPARAQFGLLFSGAGPVNRAMSGASVATPVDASGALFWNPATMSGLPSSELDFGAEFLWPASRLASSVPAGALGPAGPPVPLAGSDRGDNGIFPLPSGAVVYRPEGAPFTFGLSLFEIGGFGVNYPASTTNPVLTPQPPGGIGLGSVYSQLEVFELAPSVSYQLTDRLSLGIGPTADLASLKLDPAFIATPDAAAGGMFPHYPIGTHTRFEWGVGVQGGATYTLDGGWKVGASLKSPRWFETFGFNSQDELGRPRHFTFQADIPMVASAGVSYAGFERWLLEADFHYIDYADTPGFSRSGFDQTGALTGIGWRSIWAAALGAQYRLTDTFSVQAGYSYNDSPIDRTNAFFNVASPTVIEHSLNVGITYWVTNVFNLSVTYGHGFQHAVSGPIISPAGTIPGSSVTSVVSADVVTFGGAVLFGCKDN